MSPRTRLVAPLLVVLLLFAPVAIYCARAELFDITRWELVQSSGELMDAYRRAEVLSHKHQTVLHANNSKARIVGELVRAEKSLQTAGEEFLDLDNLVEGVLPNRLRQQPAAALTEEEACRSVLTWVNAEMAGQPEHDTVVQRLEAELHRLFPHTAE